jgi:hypothetical protein
MTTLELEARLKAAAMVAVPPRSIVDEVMQRIGTTLPERRPKFRPRRPVIAAIATAISGIAAAVTVICLLPGSAHFSLPDMQSAFERQRWVHVRYDCGQIKEEWTNLRTGESYATRYDGGVVYVNEQSNIRRAYWKNGGVIDQDTPTIYAAGQTPPRWSPQSAWEEYVAPYAHAAAATQPAGSPPPVIAVRDTIDGIPTLRFDDYYTDFAGNRFLYSQLWADPRTHLPLRIKTRLQLAEREQWKRDWSTGVYDFPDDGPSDLYDLGVPPGTPIHKDMDVAPAAVAPIIDGINHAHDSFLKNYRAIVWSIRPGSVMPLDSVDIIWREGEDFRLDHHLPAVALYNEGTPHAPLPALTPQALLVWAAHHEPLEKQLVDSRYAYAWTSAVLKKTPKPQVQIFRKSAANMLAQQSWPQAMQWPTRYFAPDFQLIDPNAEAPAGCVGLRSGGEGNSRTDYYVDPSNDYVCVTEIEWARRDGKWFKTWQYTLSDLHRVSGRIVAGKRTVESFGDPSRDIDGGTEITTIDLVPITSAQYPPGIFDSAKFTSGAKSEY